MTTSSNRISLDGLTLSKQAIGNIIGAPRRSDTSSWPRPKAITTTLPPVEPFVPELLPVALRDFVMDVADRQQSPADFGAVAALCGIAAVVGNKVRIAPKQSDDWQIVPNLWGAIIGRPSAMKSPAMTSALSAAFMLQDEMRDLWQRQCASLAEDEALAGLDAADARARAKKALKTGDRDAAKKIMAEAGGEDAEPPPCPRLIVNDATVEKLGELLNENQNGLLLVRDELPGWLARMESPEFQNERSFYLESFNGDGKFTFDRIGRGTVHIERCTVSIVGGAQPSRIAPLVRGALSGASNDGLLQRLQMTVWPDDTSSWEWIDRSPDPRARISFDRVFRDMHDLLAREDGEPVVYRFSEPAQALFREWVEEVQTEARSGTLPSTMESHILKMPKTIASLALLFEMIEGASETVGEASTLRALAWADYLRSHANRLYAAGQTMGEEGAKLIIERRDQLPPRFTARHVHQKGWAGLADRDIVATAIEMLIETHHCREASGSTASSGGRPTTAYEWNPAIGMGG